MLFHSVFCALLATAAAGTGTIRQQHQQQDLFLVEHIRKFQLWTNFHGKTYDSHEEQMKRLQTWIQNDERIRKHNEQQPPPTFQLGHNPYSDMTSEEFVQYFNLGKFSTVAQKQAAEKIFWSDKNAEESRRTLLQDNDDMAAASTLHDRPDYVNWVTKGAVTPVKNQGTCGACWAFSTAGALEGARYLKTGNLVSLSVQHLIDCDDLDFGCNGGLMDNAFQFEETSGGLCSDKDYPYTAKEGKCRTDCDVVPGSIVKTFVDVAPGNHTALLSAIALQPVSVAIQADQFVFQFYKSGVLTDDSCGKKAKVNHGVLAVGYGSDLETNMPYYLVKNSWGDSWGDHGYVKIGRGGKNKFGVCAILTMSSFPVVE